MNIPTTYVGWHCPKCGYEHEATQLVLSYPGQCPVCGDQGIRAGHAVLPVNAASCDPEPRQYSWTGGPKEVQVYLYAATGEHAGMAMDPGCVPDCTGNPIAVAESALRICDTKYVYYGNRDRVAAVLEAMKACEALSERNARANRLHELRRLIVCGMQEYTALIAAAEEEAEAVDSEHVTPLLEWLLGWPGISDHRLYTHACGTDGRVYILRDAGTNKVFWSIQNLVEMPSDLWPRNHIGRVLLSIDKAKAACEALERRLREGKV